MSMKSIYMAAAAIGAMAMNPELFMGEPRSRVPESNNILVKRRTGSLEHYIYEDGFECDAYSQELADKKHRKWYKEVGKFKQK